MLDNDGEEELMLDELGGGSGGAIIVVVEVNALALKPKTFAKAEGVKAACCSVTTLCALAIVPSVTVTTRASTDMTVVDRLLISLTPRFSASAVALTVEASRLPALSDPNCQVTSKVPEFDCNRLAAILLRYTTAQDALQGGLKLDMRADNT